MNELKASWKISGTETWEGNTERLFQAKLVIKKKIRKERAGHVSPVFRMFVCFKGCWCSLYMHFAAGLHRHLSEQTQGCVLYQRRGQDFPPLRFLDSLLRCDSSSLEDRQCTTQAPRAWQAREDVWPFLSLSFAVINGCHPAMEGET